MTPRLQFTKTAHHSKNLAMERIICVICGIFLLFLSDVDSGNYVIPTVTIEAYDPEGLIAWIPDEKTTTQFHFHGRVNESIDQFDPGKFFGEITSPINGKWTFFYPNITLKVGDDVNYWVYVQHNGFGYRRTGSATINELKTHPHCMPSITFVSGISGPEGICQNTIVLKDDFNEIDASKWLKNHYFPFYDPDYEFVTYENSEDVCYVKESKLFLKPTLRSDVHGVLDLTDGCTGNRNGDKLEECKYEAQGGYIRPPVRSAKLTSMFEIQYAKIEITAKLPAGDWIYPELYLQSIIDPSRRIIIAYSRGNEVLTDRRGAERGGKILYGGPSFEFEEPERSHYLRSKSQDETFSYNTHTYAVVWTPGQMEFMVDGEVYGEVTNHHFTDKAKLVLGVGVGGANDFGDDFKSNGIKKPWENEDRLQVKSFYKASDVWGPTWVDDNVALQIDSIKIFAI